MSNPLQKLTQGAIEASQKIAQQETQEKIRGYHQCLVPPELGKLHEHAILEAQRQRSQEFEIEAIENEFYLKETRQKLNEPLQELEHEAEETEEYWETHTLPPEDLPAYHPPKIQERIEREEKNEKKEEWDLEKEAIENESYSQKHPGLYTSTIEPPAPKLSDYDKPRLLLEKTPPYPLPQVQQETREEKIQPSQKPYQIAPPSETLPMPPLSKYAHIEPTELPTPMLRETKTGGFIKPLRKEEIPDTKTGLLRMKELIKDHAVTFISCPGPLKPVMIRRMGVQEVVKIALDEQGIRKVIQEFAEASRIPFTEGVFKAMVGDIMITAVVTEIGSRFTITRLLQ